MALVPSLQRSFALFVLLFACSNTGSTAEPLAVGRIRETAGVQQYQNQSDAVTTWLQQCATMAANRASSYSTWTTTR